MKKTPLVLYGRTSVIIHVLFFPFFLFAFALLYKPFGIEEFLNMGENMFLFNTTMLCCILAGVLLLTRLTLYFLRDRVELGYFQYGLWSFGEVAAFSAFGAMYLSLISPDGLSFFDALLLCIGCSTLILIFPFTIITLSFAVICYRDNQERPSENSPIIKFRDSRQQLKLAISSGAILYIEADNNYVIIYYLNGDRLSNYTLRSSMKDIESLVSPYGLVRCHRTYVINPAHVKLLTRNKEGYIYAETDCPEAKMIPVSKTYYERLSLIL